MKQIAIFMDFNSFIKHDCGLTLLITQNPDIFTQEQHPLRESQVFVKWNHH